VHEELGLVTVEMENLGESVVKAGKDEIAMPTAVFR